MIACVSGGFIQASPRKLDSVGYDDPCNVPWKIDLSSDLMYVGILVAIHSEFT